MLNRVLKFNRSGGRNFVSITFAVNFCYPATKRKLTNLTKIRGGMQIVRTRVVPDNAGKDYSKAVYSSTVQQQSQQQKGTSVTGFMEISN